MAEVSIFICPRCQQWAIRQPYTGDYQHDCFGNESLANESVIVIGNWTDYTGSDLNVQDALLKGKENTLGGTRPAVEGQQFYPRDTRGYPKNLYRERRHIEHINETEFKKPKMLDPIIPDDYEDKSY